MTGHIATEHFTPKPERVPSLTLVDEGGGFFAYFDRNADMQKAFDVVNEHVATLSWQRRGTVRWAIFPIDHNYGDLLSRGIVAAKLNPPVQPKRVRLATIRLPGMSGMPT